MSRMDLLEVTLYKMNQIGSAEVSSLSYEGKIQQTYGTRADQTKKKASKKKEREAMTLLPTNLTPDLEVEVVFPDFFLGAMDQYKAEEKCDSLTAFEFCYMVDQYTCVEVLDPTLPLFIVYRDSSGSSWDLFWTKTVTTRMCKGNESIHEMNDIPVEPVPIKPKKGEQKEGKGGNAVASDQSDT
ncbi:unnamed protein product [Bursaphelenchus xylophilus]|uniref:(pine wood nematode) hypothetical protein n=1 Tax=Bursaphelenchus xylophilus TaxID=6326 RepID=A0A811LRK8_BURXY|nr:unnamed protein product [Bursaphelenchus xylophilus]CAG9120496.1 unnamed protein product [Bursaphelenchus xylophilus]